jgi:hypothetical protein
MISSFDHTLYCSSASMRLSMYYSTTHCNMLVALLDYTDNIKAFIENALAMVQSRLQYLSNMRLMICCFLLLHSSNNVLQITFCYCRSGTGCPTVECPGLKSWVRPAKRSGTSRVSRFLSAGVHVTRCTHTHCSTVCVLQTVQALSVCIIDVYCAVSFVKFFVASM